MGLKKIRKSLVVKGDLTVSGNQIESPEVNTPTISGGTATNLVLTTPTITSPASTGGTLTAAVVNSQLGAVRVGTAGALGTANLPAASNGLVKLGISDGTVQIGVVINGTAYVLAGTAGGAVTLAAAS